MLGLAPVSSSSARRSWADACHQDWAAEWLLAALRLRDDGDEMAAQTRAPHRIMS
jgi:hypothetical protein